MIKPFTIKSDEITETGEHIVVYYVVKNIRNADKHSSTMSIEASIAIPEGRDRDEFLIEHLTEGGWL